MAVGVALTAMALSGCQSPSDTPKAESNFGQIPGQFPTPATTTAAGADDAPVGACVKIIGKRSDATMKLTKCESPDATHRIVQRVIEPKECVRDVDRRYYRNTAAGEWTACLDLNWTSSNCLSITDEATRAVACDDTSAPQRYRPTRVVLGARNADMCPVGYQHPARMFTICTELVR
ncbi:Putative liporotein LppU [Mycobacteroides abscessus subsp. massiliense]|uniref:Putative liporotein LppU n=1 Tax=Mycobacteroides abscessus subsp. massiliense TaxID=1962118 RepID=A0A1U2AD16_9MYCO|nr:Putative liporotein LppU [Mycobacteroides abscessus subsp. massiliense]SKS91727.1 Putative liporotein LppU [Mycobacteroides abscessus subsp. massiliense]SKT20182.1 Putative liporotein LppU [Mycobacteroides abscessus subsp. massiliense]SKW82828.1 Putative liporotein LppU [Mycobacteroides abscessus subsp. massiliense]